MKVRTLVLTVAVLVTGGCTVGATSHDNTPATPQSSTLNWSTQSAKPFMAGVAGTIDAFCTSFVPLGGKDNGVRGHTEDSQAPFALKTDLKTAGFEYAGGSHDSDGTYRERWEVARTDANISCAYVILKGVDGKPETLHVDQTGINGDTSRQPAVLRGGVWCGSFNGTSAGVTDQLRLLLAAIYQVLGGLGGGTTVDNWGGINFPVSVTEDHTFSASCTTRK